MWGVYIQELPALNMAEIITPTVSEAERLGEKGVVGKCCICSTILTVYDEIVHHEANDDIWCLAKDCETEQAWLAYYENNPSGMTTEEKLAAWQEVWNS